jgi:hypothetical protein
MSARITALGVATPARRTYETGLYVVQEWPEHIARSCAAIRARRRDESDVLTRGGQWSRDSRLMREAPGREAGPARKGESGGARSAIAQRTRP